MEAILSKLSWAILVAAGGFFIWAVKGLVKLVFDNREQIKVGFFKNVEQDKELQQINSKISKHDTKLDLHEGRIDKAELNISTLATSHNASQCGKVVKVALK